MKKYLLVLISIFTFVYSGVGQIHIEAEPQSSTVRMNDDFRIVDLIRMDEQELPNRNLENQPLYAGYTLPFEADINSPGSWHETKSGWNIWRIGIRVKNARAINIYLKEISLSWDEKIFIYNSDKSIVLGAFTSLNNSDFLGTELISGDYLTLEFNTRKNVEKLPFLINRIGVSINDIGKAKRDFGDSGPCEVLVNCPEGIDWKDERDGVARILVSESGSLFWCTGSLMNNTNLDGTPYFLTANHCGETSSEEDYSNWVFYFNFESIDCEMPANEPPHQSISGASVIASSTGSTNTGSDFKLLLLNDDVPKSYGPFYNGWDWSDDGAETGVGIHHPEGDLKMISTFDEDLISTNYNNTTPDPNGKYWMVTWAETESGHGVTEGGSSGSPIFSQEGYIVGALSGGRASCTALDKPDYYGKVSYSWESNGTQAERQLKPWLDPKNSGQQKLRGIDIDSSSILADFVANNTNVRVGGIVSFTNLSEGDIIGYEWHFEGGNPEVSEIISPSNIQYNTAGDFDVMLVAKSVKDADTLIKKNYIHVTPTVTPNPSRGYFKITFGSDLPDELDIQVTDMHGHNVNYFFEVLEKDNAIVVDLSRQASGIYIIRVVADGIKEVLKVSVVRHSTE